MRLISIGGNTYIVHLIVILVFGFFEENSAKLLTLLSRSPSVSCFIYVRVAQSA